MEHPLAYSYDKWIKETAGKIIAQYIIFGEKKIYISNNEGNVCKSR